MKFQLFDVHGERITVRTMFELLPVRRPIVSVSRLVDKGFAVVMGNDQGNKLSNNGRDTSPQIQWCVSCPRDVGAVSAGGSRSKE